MPTQFNVATRDGVVFSTTNSDLTNAVTFATRVNKLYWFEVKVMAIRTDTYDQAAQYWLAAAFRNDGGTLTQVGSTRSVITANEDAAGWIAELYTDGTTIGVRVAGEGNPVRWRIKSDIIEDDSLPQS